MISKNFIKSSAIYTIAGSLPMASAIILMPFYGELPSQVYGMFSIYVGFSLLVQILVTYSFDASIYINFHEYKNDPKQLAKFISSAFVFVLLLSLAIGVFLAVGGNWIFKAVYGEGNIPFWPFGVLSVGSGVFQALFKINNSLLQTQSKPTQFLWGNVFSFSFIAIFTIVGLKLFPESLWGPIGGKLLGVLISAAWVLASIYRQFGIHFDWKLLKTTFSFNTPSLIYQIQQWFINYYDRILLLSIILSKSTVAYYDVALKFLLAIDFILTGLNSTIHPKVLGKVNDQQIKSSTIEINRYYNGMTAIAILAVTGSLLIFPPVIRLFFNSDYHAAIPLLPLAAIIYLMRPLRLYVAMPYAALKYSKPLPVYYLFLAAFKIGIMYLFIQQWGVWGALISSLIAYVSEIALLYLGIRSKFSFKINAFKLVGAPVLLAVFILSLEPVWGNEYSLVLHAGYVVVGIVILFWAYRNEFNDIKKAFYTSVMK